MKKGHTLKCFYMSKQTQLSQRTLFIHIPIGTALAELGRNLQPFPTSISNLGVQMHPDASTSANP